MQTLQRASFKNSYIYEIQIILEVMFLFLYHIFDLTLQWPSSSNKNNETKYTLLLKTGILTIHNFIVQADARNIDKNTIKDFVTQLVAQELVIKKNTSRGNESYHKTTEKDLPQPPKHCTRTPTKTNFNKTSEVESETQTFHL